MGRPKGTRDVKVLARELEAQRKNPVLREKLAKAEVVATALLDEEAEKKARQKLYRQEYARRKKAGLSTANSRSLRKLPEFKDLSDAEFEIARRERQKAQTNEAARRSYHRKKALAKGEEFPDFRSEEYRPEHVDIEEYKELPKEQKIALKSAALASIYLGQSAAQVAAQYNIPYRSVEGIKNAFEKASSITSRDWLSEALMVYIQQEIKSLMAISMVTANEEWVMEQNAADLSMYIATKSDKLTQLLQSFGRVADERDKYVDQLEAVVQEA